MPPLRRRLHAKRAGRWDLVYERCSYAHREWRHRHFLAIFDLSQRGARSACNKACGCVEPAGALAEATYKPRDNAACAPALQKCQS